VFVFPETGNIDTYMSMYHFIDNMLIEMKKPKRVNETYYDYKSVYQQ
jgi:hypothetical protein